MQSIRHVFLLFLLTIIISLFGIGLVSAETTATTRYVKIGGSNSGSCTSITNPCASVSYAKGQSSAGDTILVGRDLVAGGIFAQSTVIDIPLTIEGRLIPIVLGGSPPSSWNPCSGFTCPTFTPPADSSAFVISPAAGETVTLNHLNFANISDASAVRVEEGKAVFNNCDFSDNINPGGGLFNIDSGAGIYVGFNAEASVNSCMFTRNNSFYGGAIYSEGNTTLDDTTFRLNISERGGAVFTASLSDLTITNSRFYQNSATGSGGAIRVFNGSAKISSTDFLTNTAGTIGGAISIGLDASVTVSDGLLQNNSAESATDDTYGGAIDLDDSTATLTNLVIRDNKSTSTNDSASGGGISVRDGSNLTIQSSTLSNNEAGPFLGADNGIVVEDSSLTIMDSTLTDHETAVFGSSAVGTSSMTVLRSTISDNSTGIFVGADNSLTLANSTIVTSGSQGTRGVRTIGNATVSLQYATLYSSNGNAASASTTSMQFVGSFDIENSIVAGGCEGGNLMDWDSASITDSSTCSADANNLVSDVRLHSLGDYGGPTETMHPLFNSPARNRGSQSDCLGIPISAKDQRGMARPIGSACDVGAVEFAMSPTAITLQQRTTNSSHSFSVNAAVSVLMVLTGGVLIFGRTRTSNTNT